MLQMNIPPTPMLRKPYSPLSRVAFTGGMCCGKTYAANLLVNSLGYAKIGFADKLKEILKDLYGVTTKNGSGRELLQQFSADCKRWDPDVWIKHLLLKVQQLETADYSLAGIVVDDLRYLKEAEALKNNGFYIIRVDTPPEVQQLRVARLYPQTSTEALQHDSETEWHRIEPDGIISGVGAYTEADIDSLFKLPKQYSLFDLADA